MLSVKSYLKIRRENSDNGGKDIRIAMLTNNYRPFVGGVPISVERQAEELIKLGHQVTVFAPMYGETQEEREAVLAADVSAPEQVVRYGTQNVRWIMGWYIRVFIRLRSWKHLKETNLTVSMYIIRCS